MPAVVNIGSRFDQQPELLCISRLLSLAATRAAERGHVQYVLRIRPCSETEQQANCRVVRVVGGPRKHVLVPGAIGRVGIAPALYEPLDKFEFAVLGGVVKRSTASYEGTPAFVWPRPFEPGQFRMLFQNVERLLLPFFFVFGGKQTVKWTFLYLFDSAPHLSWKQRKFCPRSLTLWITPRHRQTPHRAPLPRPPE